MLRTSDITRGMTEAVAAAREALDIGTDGEAVDQVVILVTWLMPDSTDTICAASPVVKKDAYLSDSARQVASDSFTLP